MFSPSAAIDTVRGLLVLSDMLKQISYAGDDIYYFKLETRTLSQLLNMFYHTVEESTKHLKDNEKRKRLVNSLFDQFTIAQESIESLVEKLVIPFNTTQSSLNGFAIRVRWYMKKETVASLRLRLESLKASANLFLNMTVCEDLRRRIRELETKKQHVPEEMTKRVQHFVQVVIRDRTTAKEAIREVASFQKSRKHLKSISRSEEAASLRRVERAIQKEIDEVIPEACISNNGREKRQERRQTTPTHSKRYSLDEQSQVDYDSDRRHPTHRQVPAFGQYPLAPEQQLTRRSPVQVPPLFVPYTFRSSRSSLQSTQSDWTQSDWTDSQRILTTQNSMVGGKKEMGNTVGHRVLDNGGIIRDEIGVWPEEVVASHRENFYQNENTTQDESIVSSEDSRLKRNHQKRKSSTRDRQSSAEDSDVVEDASSGINATGKVLRRRRQINYRNLQPLPPFNKVDLDEKLRRQSESRETDSE